MGKAAKRRKAYQKRTLAELSHRDPADFMVQWDMRLESWLIDVRKRTAEWRDGAGEGARRQVFTVLDGALNNAKEILQGCEPSVAARVLKKTYDELSHECSAAVASVVNGKLCHLSSTYNVMQMARR